MSRLFAARQRRENDRIFTEWMADHRGIIVKIVRGFTTNPADAEDLSQNIALAIWRSIPSFEGKAKPSTWIWRIALNQAISWQRSARPDHDEATEVVDLSAPDRADESVMVDRIYQAIQGLKPIDRALIMLSLEGCSYTEMADITGLTTTNVGARITRARARLSSQLEETT